MKPYSQNLYFYNALSNPRCSKQICKAAYWKAHLIPALAITIFFSPHIFSSNSFHLAFIPQNHSLQITSDLQFSKPYVFLFAPYLSLNKANSFFYLDGFGDVTFSLWFFFPFPFQLQSLRFFVSFSFMVFFSWLFLFYSNSYCWYITDLGLDSSFSFLFTLFKAWNSIFSQWNLCLQPRTSVNPICVGS